MRPAPSHAPLLAALSLAALFLAARPAQATPRPLPITYGYATNRTGDAELEQSVDVTPVPAFDALGAQGLTPRAILQSELEIGLTDHVEFALYIALANFPGQLPGQQPLEFWGMRQRLRIRFFEAGTLPVDTSLYLEVSELTNELELETRLMFEHRVSKLRTMLNLKVERELYYNGNREWVFNPSLGSVWEFTPAFGVGIEGFLHKENGGPPGDAVANFNRGLQAYVGPTLVAQFKRVWLNAGVYARLNDLDRTAQVGDQFGRLWARTMIGIEL